MDLCSFAIPFLFSFERRWMHFIRFWKPYFLSFIIVGIFFIVWDVYFAYTNVWGFNNDYLVGIYFLKLPLEEWLFFLLIPYSSNFIHYSLEYFFPNFKGISQRSSNVITIILLIIGASVAVFNYDKAYTVVNFGVFASVMLLQLVFKWPYIRRFYLSFLLIYIPFFIVNSALTGFFTDKPVVFYDNAENLGIRLGTMPIEDSFYCFSMLYGSVLLFEFLRRRWSYCLDMNYKNCKI